MGKEWLWGEDDHGAAGVLPEEGLLCPHSSLDSLGIYSQQVLLSPPFSAASVLAQLHPCLCSTIRGYRAAVGPCLCQRHV